MSTERLKALAVDRVAELVENLEIDEETEFTYSWNHGYEMYSIKHDKGGSLEYRGSYHGPDGMCHTLSGSTEGICMHCGRTLM